MESLPGGSSFKYQRLNIHLINMKIKILIILTSVIVLSILTWYIIATINFNKDEKELVLLSEEIEEAISVIINNGRVQERIDYKDLVAYKDKYESNRQKIEDISNRFKENEGTGIWYKKVRLSKADNIDAILDYHDKWYNSISLVVEALDAIYIEVENQVAANTEGRRIAREGFTKNSDDNDFEKQYKQIDNLTTSTEKLNEIIISQTHAYHGIKPTRSL